MATQAITRQKKTAKPFAWLMPFMARPKSLEKEPMGAGLIFIKASEASSGRK
jgi:hypothetical protein